MDLNQLKSQYIELKREMYGEGFVGDNFKNFKQIFDADTEEMSATMNLYFEDNEQVLRNFSAMLDQPKVDFDDIYEYLIKLRGSSTCIGALKVTNKIEKAMKCCVEKINLQSCIQYIQEIKVEFYRLKFKVEEFIKLEQQIIAAGGTF